MGIKSYQELDVWQKAVELVTEIYRIVRDFPREELYCLTNQIQRAAISIPANIAEGWGRSTTKDYIQFLRISRGSLLELETHLVISRNLNYINSQTLEKTLQEIHKVGKMLNALITSLTRYKNPHP